MAKKANSGPRRDGTKVTHHPEVQITQSIAQRRAQNIVCPVNKLSPELLSHIFLIGEESERGSRHRALACSYIGLQERASHVCNYWRNVAIACPALWTYIHLTSWGPSKRIRLYVSRAGSNALFDVEVDVRSGFAFEPKSYHSMAYSLVAGVNDIFFELKYYGAPPSRWKSLRAYTKEEDVLVEFLRCLNSETAPELQYLRLQSRVTKHTREEDMGPSSTRYNILSKSSAPNLRRLELNCVPWEIMLVQPYLLLPFSELTDLSITAGYMTYEVSDFHNLISSSSRLETLYIITPLEPYTDDKPSIQAVSIPSLCSLTIISQTTAEWPLRLVKMIYAPSLRSLTIRSRGAWKENAHIAEYIATGISSGSTLPTGPLFPVLRELDIYGFQCLTENLRRMLSVLPTVTHASFTGMHLDMVCLAQAPWLLPNLETLVFPGIGIYAHLGSVLQARAKAGICPMLVRLRHPYELQAKNVYSALGFVQFQAAQPPTTSWWDYSGYSEPEDSDGLSDSDDSGSENYH